MENEGLNPAEPAIIMINKHGNEHRYAIQDDSHSESWLVSKSLSIIEGILIHINQASRVHTPDNIIRRGIINDSAVRVLMPDHSGHSILHGGSDRGKLTGYHLTMFKADSIMDPFLSPLPGGGKIISLADRSHKGVRDSRFTRALKHAIGVIRNTEKHFWKGIEPLLDSEFRLIHFRLCGMPIGIRSPFTESVLIEFIAEIYNEWIEVWKISLANMANKIKSIDMLEGNLQVRDAEGVQIRSIVHYRQVDDLLSTSQVQNIGDQ